MAIVDLGPVNDIPTLVLPHASYCRSGRTHPDTHCYSERRLEDRVEEYLVTTFPHSRVRRQERWPGVGVVDLTVRTDIPFGTVLTVIELKVTPTRYQAHRQLTRYMDAAQDFFRPRDEPVSLVGILGAFWFRDYLPFGQRPGWLSYWQMDVQP